MKKIEETFKDVIFKEIVIAVCYFLLGFIIFIKSDMTNIVVGLLIGLFLLINSAFLVYTSIMKIKIKAFRYNFIFGIIGFILAIFIMFNPLKILNILNITLGIFLIIEAVNKLILYKYLNSEKDIKKIILTSGILLLVFGIILIINPFRTQVITKTVGMFIMVYNVININDYILFKKRCDKVIKLFK